MAKLQLRRDLGRKFVRGVEYVLTADEHVKTKLVVRANREVRVAAGPYRSPKLLQLYGIGPHEILEKFGIDFIIDIPVGKRVQARPIELLMRFILESTFSEAKDLKKIYSDEAWEIFIQGDGVPSNSALHRAWEQAGITLFSIRRLCIHPGDSQRERRWHHLFAR